MEEDIELEFIECDICSQKPETSTKWLCYGCLHNREVIIKLKKQIAIEREED